MYRELKSPLNVSLELTTRCNNRCIHCYNYWRQGDDNDQTLSEEEIHKIVANMAENEVLSLTITGGEPLLYPNLVFKIIEIASSLGVKCTLNTNATLITDEIACKLKQFKISVLTSVLSWNEKTHDEITSTKGAFARCMNGISVLMKHEVPVYANMVVMQKNIDHVYATGKFVHDLGIKTFCATKVHPAQGSANFSDFALSSDQVMQLLDALLILRDEVGLKVETLSSYPLCLVKDMERYGDLLKNRGCFNGKTSCTIGANGQMRVCGHSDTCYGNVIDNSIKEVWPKLKAWRDGSLLPGECKSCKHVVECSGGCRMDAKHFGRINDMDPYATMNSFCYTPRKQKAVSPLSCEMLLCINPRLCFRDESFGTVLSIGGMVKSIVNADSAKLLKELAGASFSIDGILHKHYVNRVKLVNFLTTLYHRDIVCAAT